MTPVKTILHPTDFSLHSAYALELACALARDQGARLIVLHAVPSPRPVTGAGDVAALGRAETCQQDLKGYKQTMLTRLQELPLPGLNVRPERLLREGDIVAVILGTADAFSCDLIVMGTHGWTAETQKLMGSVAHEVTQKASCPVLTVRGPVTWPQPAQPSVPEEAGVIL